VKKKKVSFDIDSKLYINIQEFCKNRGIKQSDFFRDASLEKYEKEEREMIIYVPYCGKIDKYIIDTNKYLISIWEASEEMKENVGAVCEGTIKQILTKDTFQKLGMVMPNAFEDTGSPIDALLEPEENNPSGQLSFFTKQKYTIIERKFNGNENLIDS
jgi:hypothetical protein